MITSFFKFAVRQYWIVSPAARRIEIYKMENNRYRLLSAVAEEGSVKPDVLQGFELDLADIFGEPLV